MFQPSSKTTLEELASHILDGNALVQETFSPITHFKALLPHLCAQAFLLPTSLSEWWQSGGKVVEKNEGA